MNTLISERLGELRNELTTWFMSLDYRNAYYFEQVYENDRRVLVNALSGWTITDDELAQYPTLASLLAVDPEGDHDPATVLPHVGCAFSPVTVPATTKENESFKIEWVDVNYGAATAGYEDAVVIRDGSNTDVFHAMIELGALDRDAQMSAQVEVPGLPAGTYRLTIVHNSSGGNPDAAQYAIRSVGLASFTESELTVGSDFGY